MLRKLARKISSLFTKRKVVETKPVEVKVDKNDFDSAWNEAAIYYSNKYADGSMKTAGWRVLDTKYLKLMLPICDSRYITEKQNKTYFNNMYIQYRLRGSCLYTFKFYGSRDQYLFTDVIGDSLWDACEKFAHTIKNTQDLLDLRNEARSKFDKQITQVNSGVRALEEHK
jgi:hypothetical protein